MKRGVAAARRRRTAHLDPLEAQFQAACRKLARAGLRATAAGPYPRHGEFRGVLAEVYEIADRAEGAERAALLGLAAAHRRAADGEVPPEQVPPLRAAVARLRELPL